MQSSLCKSQLLELLPLINSHAAFHWPMNFWSFRFQPKVMCIFNSCFLFYQRFVRRNRLRDRVGCMHYKSCANNDCEFLKGTSFEIWNVYAPVQTIADLGDWSDFFIGCQLLSTFDCQNEVSWRIICLSPETCRQLQLSASSWRLNDIMLAWFRYDIPKQDDMRKSYDRESLPRAKS